MLQTTVIGSVVCVGMLALIPIVLILIIKTSDEKEIKKEVTTEKRVYYINEVLSIPYVIYYNMEFKNGICSVSFMLECKMKDKTYTSKHDIDIQFDSAESLDILIKNQIDLIVNTFENSTNVLDYKNELLYKKLKGVI